MPKAPLLFNPRLESHETLEAIFVGREEILQELLGDLARQASAGSRQHWLIRAPRGYGKTHLAAIVNYRVQSSPELARSYLPVWLSEAATYEVYSSGTLVLGIAQRLAEVLVDRQDPGAGAFQEELHAIRQGGDDPELFEEVVALLKRTASSRGLILLVLMENLDALLHSFVAERRKAEESRVRSLLAEDRELLFIATTPTRHLRRLQDPSYPLYGHLRSRDLPGLGEDEIGELFARLAAQYGDAATARLLQGEGDARLRRRVLHRLAGGSPRSVIMAFCALSTGTLVGVVEELQATLDRHTSYFEARLAGLAPRERAIVTALAQAADNLTLKGIAAATRLPERSLSTQVKRLVEEGHVEDVLGTGCKGAVYALTDGLFRVWYQYRKGSRLLSPLVRFLALLSPEEMLEEAVSELAASFGETVRPFERELRESAGQYVREALAYLQSEAGRRERAQLWDQCQMELAAETGGLPLVPGARADVPGEPEGPARLAQILVQEGLRLRVSGEHEKALVAFDEVLRRSGDLSELDLATHVALALVNKGIALGDLGRSEEEVAAYDEVIRRIGDRPEADLATQVARALVNKGLALGDRGRSQEAIAAYDEVLRRFGNRPEPDLATQVARALANKGLVLSQFGQIEEAIAAYEEVLRRVSSFPPPGDASLALLAQCLVAATHSEAGRTEDAAEHVRRWFVGARHAPHDAPGAVQFGLRELAGTVSLDLLAAQLEEVGDASQTFVETAAPFRHVVAVLRAGELRDEGRGRMSPAMRRRRAMALVPPELRATVEELVQALAQVRQRRGRRKAGAQKPA